MLALRLPGRVGPEAVILSALVLLGLATLPFVSLHAPLAEITLPTVLMTSIVIDVATFWMLSAAYLSAPRRSIGFLAAAFLLEAALSLGVLLTFPFGPALQPMVATGLYGGAWIVVMLRTAPGLAVLTYLALRRFGDAPLAEGRAVGFLTRSACGLTGLALTLLAMVELLKSVPLTTAQGAGISLAATLAALIALAATPRKLWLERALLLTLAALTIDLILSLVPGGRYSAGWYVASLCALASTMFVFIAAVREMMGWRERAATAEADSYRADVLDEALNEAVRASIVKSRFVATVSHEIRTPLNGIIGTAELLGETTLSLEQVRLIDTVDRSARQLLAIVNDLLDFSRAEAGKIELTSEHVDLQSLADSVTALFEAEARRKRIALTSSCNGRLPPLVLTDPVRVRQILTNLVSNALRFTERGGVRLDVSLGAQDGDAAIVHFAVSDSGVGIDADALARIFEPFMQEDKSTNRRFGGTGLGLAISRHLATLMGGTLEVESAPGAGSRFTLVLPVHTAVETPAVGTSLLGQPITLVAADPEQADAVGAMLAGWGMQLDTYRDFGAALVSLRMAARLGRAVGPVLVAVPEGAVDRAASFAAEVRSDPRLAQAELVLAEPGGKPQTALRAERAGFSRVVSGGLRGPGLFNFLLRLRPRRVDAVAGALASRARVLVVEDNAINRDLLVAQLDRLGIRADAVSDGASAIEAVAKAVYDLVFMDCHMPVIDGYAATRRIREAERSTGVHLPIVAVTANAMPGSREVCISAGMDDVLTKPIVLAPLAAVVERWTGVAAAAPVIDPAGRERLLEIVGDPIKVDALVESALETMQREAVELTAAIAAREAERVAQLAHRIKGVAAEVGACELAAIAKALQNDGQEGRLADAEAVHAEFILALDRFAAAVRRTAVAEPA